LRLADDLAALVATLGGLLMQQLKRHAAVELLVVGRVDDAHAAFA
jgi:hypothetical protein